MTNDSDLQVGARVRIRRDATHGPGPWPAEPFGVVGEHPDSAPGQIWRPVETTSGPKRFYWVVFDDPQFDGDGDGPYQIAEVLDMYIERVEPN